MSSNSREERERLKEEYKEHYRKIREARERLARSKRTQKISNALKDMDTSQLTETFDEFLFKVKSKIANVEARLDVAMDSLSDSSSEDIEEQERDEELRRARAKETLKQAKIEMGMLYNEIEQQADSLEVEKTIGRKNPPAEESNPNAQKEKESDT